MKIKPAGGNHQDDSLETNALPCHFSEIDKQLLNDFQYSFPLSARPYKDIAAITGTNENDVLGRYRFFHEAGIISRIGPVIRVNTIGVSTLVAMSVPDPEIEKIAAIINDYPGVNHNYEREGEYNLWFVVTATDRSELAEILEDMREKTGFELLDLPMLDDYHIDLGFDLKWQE